jgi:hypothetical protein
MREALGLSPGVVLSQDEIAKALAALPQPTADEIRAQLDAPVELPRNRYAFGGVRR